MNELHRKEETILKCHSDLYIFFAEVMQTFLSRIRDAKRDKNRERMRKRARKRAMKTSESDAKPLIGKRNISGKNPYHWFHHWDRNTHSMYALGWALCNRTLAGQSKVIWDSLSLSLSLQSQKLQKLFLNSIYFRRNNVFHIRWMIQNCSSIENGTMKQHEIQCK